MSSPIYIRIYNYTNTTLKTEVTKHRDLEDAGANFNDKTINAGTALESDTIVKSGTGNGELSISLYQASNNVLIGYFNMKDLKNPHEGFNSIEIPEPAGTYQLTSAAFRHLENEPEDNRYIYLAVNNYPSSSTLP